MKSGVAKPDGVRMLHFLVGVCIVATSFWYICAQLPVEARVAGGGLQLKQVSTGSGHSCAVASDGKAYCWGYNGNGQLGNGTTSTTPTSPVAVSQGEMPAGATIRYITAGRVHTCAIASDNKAYCWGDGSNGKLGNDATSQQTAPVAVSQGAMPAGATVRQLVAGNDYTCAIASDNKAYCWGSGNTGRLGNGLTDDQDTPVAVSQGAMPAGATIRQIATATDHTCAIASDNKAYCWGTGSLGRLGNNSALQQDSPVAVLQGAMSTGATIRYITAGRVHTCAIASDNKAYCWGYNSNGQLGDDSISTRTTPVAVLQGAMPTGATIRYITAGRVHTCAIASDNKAYCWGLGSEGQLGDGTTSSTQDTPAAVSQGAMPAGATVVQIATATDHTCAIGSDGAAYCWGFGTTGQLGDGGTSHQSVPVAVASVYHPVAVSQSVFRVYGPSASTSPGSPLAAANTSATIGEIAGEFRLRIGLTNLEEPTFRADSIATGANHSCAIASNGKAYCWGAGSNGQLGNGTTTATQSTPVAVSQGEMPAGVTILQVAAGFWHSCAIASDHKAYCWGDGAAGKLGNDASSQQTTPVAVERGEMPEGATFLQIVTGADHTCAIASDNKAYCWGYGGSGQLGNGTTAGYQATPVAVSLPAGVTARQISTIFNHTCVVGSNNRGYCWGQGSNGRLGDGSKTQRNSPVLVLQGAMPSGAMIRQISAGGNHTCAIASDNKGYCWGNGSNGRLGNGDFAEKTSPVLVLQGAMPSGAMIRQMSAGDGHTCAIASDNKSYCWGYGGAGQFGDGTTSGYQDTPLATSLGAMPAGTTVYQLATGSGHTCAIASDGKPYCWGYGASGQIGNNSTGDQTTPAAVLQGAITDTTTTIGSSQLDLSLQVAPLALAGTCSAVASGWETISSGSAMAWGSAPPSHGTAISAFGSDPTAPTGAGYVYQTVIQNGSFTNGQAIGPQQTGLWDVVLRDRSSHSTTSYCIRIVSNSSTTSIDSRDVHPQVTTALGSLDLQFVDGSGTPLSEGDTGTSFSPLAMTSYMQTTTAQLTDSTYKQLEVRNSISNSGWNVSLAATNGPTATWQSGSSSYDYNAADSADGQLSVNLNEASLAAYGSTPNDEACSPSTGVSLGASTATYSDSITAITLLTGSSSAQFNCTWRIRDINLSQTVPPYQTSGLYTLDLTATVVAN